MLKKNLFKSLITSIILVFAIVFLASCGKKSTPTTKPDDTNNNNNNGGNNQLLSTARSIKVVQVDGGATVTDSKTTTNCFKGMNLYDGDTLTVNADSTLVIKFDDDKYVYLGEKTIINIKSEGKDKYKTNVYVTQGVVLAEIQKKLDEDEEFFLSSNNSVMAVRGTIFGLNVENKGENLVQTYSVYKGVTELYVFDKLNDRLISGKISDISDAKYELIIPKSHIIDETEINDAVGEWLDKGASTFDDANDANNKLDEVAITVSKPTKADFEKVINVVETDVNYSDIEYSSKGFFGEYDGAPHKAVITPTTEGATVSYSLDGINYQAENDFEFYSPGSYRVYYKIECEGYDTKEDFEVIYITRPNIAIESDYLNYDSTAKMSILDISTLSSTDFNRFNGVAANKVFLNQKFYINGTEVVANNVTVNYSKLIDGYIELVDGINTLNVSFEFDTYTLNVDVYFLYSETREDSGYAIGISDTTNITELSNNVYNVSPDATYLESVGVGASYRFEGNGLLQAFGLDVLDLTTMYINYPKDVIDTDLANYDGSSTNDGNDERLLEDAANKFVEINFLVFPNATTKGFNESIFIHISNTIPDVYPSYSINKTSYAYSPTKNPNGAKMDFITVSGVETVKYSLDGTNFQDDLYITEAGVHKVYYEIVASPNSNDFNVIDYEFINVTVGEGEITFDNKMFITNPVHILSNDNENNIHWNVGSTEFVTYEGNVESQDGRVITSLMDAYTVYSNMIKNSVFYDSITKEVLDATVTVTPKKDNSANFNYTVEVEGYDTLSGTVRFENSELGELSNLNENQPEPDYFTVTLPDDYSISLSEIPQAIPSRISSTLEDEFINYQTYYSIDGGKTWSTVAPKITTAGEVDAYILYCFVDNGNDATTLVDGEITGIKHSSLAANGNFIIDIQHITVTE